MFDDNGDVTPEYKAQAMELVEKVGTICKDYNPAIVLFVLEAALEAQIASFSPPLSELFVETMRTFKGKAALMLTVARLLKGKADAIRNGASVEDLLAELGITAVPETEPKE